MRAAELARASKQIATSYNTHYMLGAFGQVVTEGFISQKAAQLPGWYTASKKAELRRLIGTNCYAFDCVCLIKAILWGWPSVRYRSTFASWVYNSTLYVRELSGSRAVISTQRTGAITGAVNVADLQKL